MRFKKLLFAALSVFAFAACNDTPESPYNPGGGTGGGGTTTNGFAYINETFATSLGAFTTQQEVGNYAWKHEVYNSNGYAKASGFANGASQNAISWLISPSFDLSKETKAYVSFEYVINKGEISAAATNHKLMVTSEYTGDATTTEWTEVDFGAVNNNSWSFQKTGNVSLPIDFIGAENVVIAFKYISTTETSSTWEVNNVLVTGEVGATEEYNPVVNKPSIEGENLLENSGFEAWENNKPLGWGLTVTNGTYSQSSEANSGVASVLIEGNASSNKRLASKSYTLKAGTYTLAAYFKSTGDAAGQFRLGYAKLTDGVVADTQNDYIYITSAAQVPSAWGQSYESFTLETETEIAIIIMNSKYGSGASILVDDVTLTTTDGGIVEGTGSEEPETPETPAGTYISEAFTNGFGAFTTQETVGDYAWVSDAQYGAKASGYANGASQDAESWLISPAIDFTNETAAYIAFDYVINKGDASAAAANHKLLITSNYTGDVATTEWTEINYGAVNNNSWTFHNTGNIALPESMMGKDAVVIAFKYMSTTANSSTWEIKNVVVASGTGATPEQPETPDTPDTPAAEAGVFDFTNPEGLTPSVERATVAAGSAQGACVEFSDITFTNGNVSVNVAQGSASTPVRLWTRTGGDVELRTYKNSTITISVSEGTMSSIVFEGGKVGTMSASTGSFSAGTWSGDAQSVTFSVTGTLNIQKLTVK
ncbi:MAG: choice-of-anchor J domain-containing protein [Bacteroidaceae bacterium]|nr:choice-of-anchor J domain-containing protein [Bacteroidaceae bacterium]